MEKTPIDNDVKGKIVVALQRSTLFATLDAGLLTQVAGNCELFGFKPGETIVSEGDAADAFYMILSGNAVVLAAHKESGEPVELARMGPADGIGELGLLLDQPRTATVKAANSALLLRLDRRMFDALFERAPGFARAICGALATRMTRSIKNVVGAEHDLRKQRPDADTISLMPMEFIQRHRVVPVAHSGTNLTVGFVDAPTPRLVNLVRQLVPSMEIRTVSVEASAFDELLQSLGGAGVSGPGAAKKGGEKQPPTGSIDLDQMLSRMVAEGASDLHLAGGEQPRWRIDGEMLTIGDAPRLAPNAVFELLDPVMTNIARDDFVASNDGDFAYAIPGLARFRVNIFRDRGGAGAVLRVIPAKILTIEQLGLPKAARAFCDHPKGMVLVTGPTGSGKSTTLAAMVDHINKTKKGHIITLEDPIEFVHQSQMCLMNQREIGSHTQSFSRALRAALREDPDIVLVGEMRDLETVAMALEIANTGHLVFGTLHTTTAIGTIDRIVEMFPHEQQNQVRSSLAETLKGVVAQTLCKKVGGGRLGVYEILVCNAAVSNLIREGKTHQVASIMQTGKALGNTILNEQLALYVTEGKVTFEEALSKCPDKHDLGRRLKREVPDH